MKLVISKWLFNKLDEFNRGGAKPKFMEKIATVSPQGAHYVDTGVLFINKLISDINYQYSGEMANSIDSVQSIDDLEFDDSFKPFIGEVRQDGNESFARFCIANSDKAGNTLLVQQLVPDLVEILTDNIDYLFSNQKRFVYFTYDLTVQNYTSTVETAVRSAAGLGYDIIELIPSDHNLTPFASVKELNDKYLSGQNSGNNGFEFIKNNVASDTIKLSFDTKSDAVGSALYQYTLYLLAVFKLNNPNITFDVQTANGTVSTNSDNSLTLLNNLFNHQIIPNYQPKEFKYARGNSTNTLIFGAPGTGKSFYVNNELKPKYDAFERVTFFADYDYTDFVGGLKPIRSTSGSIDYKFVPGVFARQLANALENPDKKFLVIIEEINRANAANVFGEVFQLLDRNSSGISEFGISNVELGEYLDQKIKGHTFFASSEIKMPGNLSIVATMNPGDQGVFTLDAAFKRRWRTQYMPIQFNIENGSPDAKHNKTNVAGFDLPWKTVAETLNKYLVNNLQVDEDERIGQYFLQDDELVSAEEVSAKLLGYLWNDVARYNRSSIFKAKTFGEVQDTFTGKQPLDVFSDKDDGIRNSFNG